jgi:hypothetical protein
MQTATIEGRTTMRFMSIVKSSESHRMAAPPAALMEAIEKLGEKLTSEGVMVGMGGLLPSAVDGFRVRQQGRKLNITDGPFAEAKEVIGGFAIFEVASREEAMDLAILFMELHLKHWPEWEGETEVRRMFEGDGCPDASALQGADAIEA